MRHPNSPLALQARAIAKTYGWKVIGAIQPANFDDPTPKEVADLIDQIEAEKVPVIFGSEVFPSDVRIQRLVPMLLSVALNRRAVPTTSPRSLIVTTVLSQRPAEVRCSVSPAVMPNPIRVAVEL